MIREIVQVGDKVLRQKCAPVTRFDGELCALLDDMKETLRKAEGAGLAAPQVEQVGPEGCLSIRGKAGTVRRPSKVKLLFQDRNGDKYSLVARDFFARAVCHELDHLDGVLYTDKAENVHDAD